MDRSVLQCKAACSVGEPSWHYANCYWRPWVDFPIANALEVLIHFDMLIRGHYARNEIKWQREVICLSVNWVFLAGGVCFFLPLSLAFAFKWIKWRKCGRMLENHFFVSRCCFLLSQCLFRSPSLCHFPPGSLSVFPRSQACAVLYRGRDG